MAKKKAAKKGKGKKKPVSTASHLAEVASSLSTAASALGAAAASLGALSICCRCESALDSKGRCTNNSTACPWGGKVPKC